MLRIFANNIRPAFTPDDLTFRTHWFDARTNFHSLSRFAGLPHSICNSAAAGIIGCHFHLHLISGHDADKIQSHLAGKVTQYDVAIGQLHAKQRIGQTLHNLSFNFYISLMGHTMQKRREHLPIHNRDSR